MWFLYLWWSCFSRDGGDDCVDGTSTVVQVWVDVGYRLSGGSLGVPVRVGA